MHFIYSNISSNKIQIQTNYTHKLLHLNVHVITQVSCFVAGVAPLSISKQVKTLLSTMSRNLVYIILHLHLLCCLFAYFLRGRRFSKPLKIHSVTHTAEMLGIVVHENMKLGDNNYNEWLLAVNT